MLRGSVCVLCLYRFIKRCLTIHLDLAAANFARERFHRSEGEIAIALIVSGYYFV